MGAEEKSKVRLIVLDSKRVKMKWSHSVNPSKEVLDDAVDLKDIVDATMSGVESRGKSNRRLPKKSKMNRLSRSGMVKDESESVSEPDVGHHHRETERGDRKPSKRKLDAKSKDVPEEQIDVIARKERKKSKKRKTDIEQVEVESLAPVEPLLSSSHTPSGSGKEFSHDSGVVGVEVMAANVTDNKMKSKKKSAGVDLSLLSGGVNMQAFGTGGSSAWD